MRQQTRASKEPAEKVVQDIRRATRKHYSAEEKIRIVLEGLRGEDSIAELVDAALHRPRQIGGDGSE
jgi:transposase